MAAYIPVPRDLTRVKSKILFNLTKRQLLCFGAAALLGVPSFFLFKSSGNVSAAALGMMIIMLPFFFLGMYERDGQPFETIAKQFIQAKFIRPKVRPYKTDNYYAILLRQENAERQIKCIVQGCSPAEQPVRKCKTATQAAPAESTVNGQPASCFAKQNHEGR